MFSLLIVGEGFFRCATLCRKAANQHFLPRISSSTRMSPLGFLAVFAEPGEQVTLEEFQGERAR